MHRDDLDEDDPDSYFGSGGAIRDYFLLPETITTDQGGNFICFDISWDGNKVVSASDDNKNYTFDYDKKVKTCKGYIPSMFLDDIKNWSDHEILFVAHPELAGLRTNKLPKGYKSNYGNEVFSYEFDASGYISKIIVRDSNQSTFSYNLTWE